MNDEPPQPKIEFKPRVKMSPQMQKIKNLAQTYEAPKYGRRRPKVKKGDLGLFKIAKGNESLSATVQNLSHGSTKQNIVIMSPTIKNEFTFHIHADNYSNINVPAAPEQPLFKRPSVHKRVHSRDSVRASDQMHLR